MTVLVEKLLENITSIINTNKSNDDKMIDIKSLIASRLNVLNGIKTLQPNELEKKRKRFYYLKKKELSKLRQDQKDELEELKLYGFGSRKYDRRDSIDSDSESSSDSPN